MNIVLNKNQVAELLQISERQVDYLRQTGKLAWVKIERSVRFRLEDVEDYVQRQRRVTAPVETNQKGGVS
jgi:predicted DNA-binding transcriptional regulator AlpA